MWICSFQMNTFIKIMRIYWNKRKRLYKKRVQLPQDRFGTPTWSPFHCFGTPRWPPRRHVKTLYWENTLSMILNWFCTQGKFFLELRFLVVSLVLLLNLEKGVLNSTNTETVLSMKEPASPTSTARLAPPKFRCRRCRFGSCVWIFCPLWFHSLRRPMFDWHHEFCPQVLATSLYLYNTWHVDWVGLPSWKNSK